MVVAPLTLFVLLAGCSWIDTNDCALAPSAACEVYRPRGLLCGLVHAGWSWREPPHDYAGALCTVGDVTTNPAVGRAQCPEGLTPADGVVDDESSASLRACAWNGNAERSSADVVDVPAGLACGLNTVGDLAPTHNLCGDSDPLEGECPPGFELRFARDVHSNCLADEDANDTGCETREPSGSVEGDCPAEGLYDEAHLLVWCEAVDGCVDGACALDFGGVCGLAPVGVSRIGAGYWTNLEREIACQSEGLFQAYQEAQARDRASLEAGEPGSRSCLGYDLGLDACPAGLTLTCTPECSGSGDDGGVDDERCGPALAAPAGGLCWCTTPEAALTGFEL